MVSNGFEIIDYDLVFKIVRLSDKESKFITIPFSCDFTIDLDGVIEKILNTEILEVNELVYRIFETRDFEYYLILDGIYVNSLDKEQRRVIEYKQGKMND